jgi:hypothetical protein
MLTVAPATEVEALPGMTRRAPGPADAIQPFQSLSEIPPNLQRQVVLLATASISDSNIFNNGLYQNCFLLYRLAEALGYLPVFVVNSKPKDLTGIPEILRTCRLAEIEDILKQPVKVKLYLEIGMSISSNLRRFLKMLGSRNCKLYLGNILNIDMETPMFFHGMNFSHHVIGEQDEIWTSPHYAQHAEYAAALNQVEPSGKSMRIAPYVWEPSILTDDGRRHVAWRPRRADEKPCVIIMEPNISFQKNAVVPTLIAEELARLDPGQDFDLVILNGDRLCASGYFKAVIEPSLTLAQKGRIKYMPRSDMVSVMRTYPHATAICYHLNNEFNYMVLEFMHAGFPVLHNCRAWKDFGYFYPDHDTRAGASQLKEALTTHQDRLEAYKGHSRALAWRHSIYNPDVQKAWKALIEGEE